MDPKLLVRVYRRLENGKVRIGTGYPVAGDRVLVARHVVAEDGEEIDLTQIELTFFRHRQPDKKRTRVVPSRCAWDGGGTTAWDAVIFECTFPECFDISKVGLCNYRPRTDEKWESEGFPETGQLQDRREPQPLKGTTHQCADDAKTFHLVVDGAAMSAEAWAGASGAPVFVGQRILGLITETRDAYGGNRILAIPMFRLLEIPEFRDALGISPQEAIDRARYAAQIQKLLLAAPSVMERMEKSLSKIREERGVGLNIQPRAGLSGNYARADVLIQALVYEKLAPDDARDVLVEAFQECVEGDSEEKTLLEIVCWYLPIGRNVDGAERIRWQCDKGLNDLIELSASDGLAAEAVMAAGGERQAVLVQDTKGNFHGKFKIPGTPPLALETVQATGLINAVEDHANAIFGAKSENRKPSRKAINALLERNRRRKRLYYLFDIASNAVCENREKIERIAQEIRTELPWIAILLLSNDQDVVDDDFLFFSNLRDVLRRG